MSVNSEIRIERSMGIVAIVLIAVVWFAGNFRTKQNLLDDIKRSYNGIGIFETIGDNVYKYFSEDSSKLNEPYSYLLIGEGHGYGGPLGSIVEVSSAGNINKVKIFVHRETSYFFNRIVNKGILTQFAGESCCQNFLHNENIQAISGATISSIAIIEAVQQACQHSSNVIEGCSSPVIDKISFRIVPLDIWIIFLFFFGWLGTRKWFPKKKIMRWGSLIISVVILGFVYNTPLSVININRLIIGYLPDWRLHPNFYLLLFGAFGYILITGKNIYCERICPFLGIQEGLAWIGGAKKLKTKNWRKPLIWAQRILTLITILIAVYYRKPAISSYEIYGVFFHMVGSIFLYILLTSNLIFSIFAQKPWCTYFCPIRPITDFVRLFRNWTFPKVF